MWLVGERGNRTTAPGENRLGASVCWVSRAAVWCGLQVCARDRDVCARDKGTMQDVKSIRGNSFLALLVVLLGAAGFGEIWFSC